MVTIGMNYHVLAGKEPVFEAAFRRVLDAIRSAQGHAESRLYREVAEPSEDGSEAPSGYLIVSRWTSEQAFEDFIASDAFKKVTNWGRENILAARPAHTTYVEQG